MAVGPKMRFAILERDGFRCRYCGVFASAQALEVDHVTPVALGGRDIPENLVTACSSCNLGKGATPLGGSSLGLANPGQIRRTSSAPKPPGVETDIRRMIRGGLGRGWSREHVASVLVKRLGVSFDSADVLITDVLAVP